MTAVSNSSVLIALSSLGQLALVQQRFPSGILIPNAVWREVVEEGGDHPGARVDCPRFFRESAADILREDE